MAGPVVPPWHRSAGSTEVRVGRILVILGMVSSGLTAAIMLGVAALLQWVASSTPAARGDALPAGLMTALYLVLALLALAGLVVAMTGYGLARAGAVHRAGIRALVGSLLLPVNAIILAGAILWILSPEAKASAPRRDPNHPPTRTHGPPH